MDKQKYWATAEGEELVNNIHSKADDYYRYIEDSCLFFLWQRSYLAYYGSNLSNTNKGQLFDAAKLSQQDSLVRLKVNHYRNVLKHTLQLATSKKPAFACRATNTDYKSQSQTVLANGLVDYYLREKKLTQVMFEGLEKSLIFSEGWIHSPWDNKGGEVFDVHPVTGAPIYQGDLKYSVHSPFDIIRDIELENDDHQWKIIRTYVNKWDLAAEHPEAEDEIINVSAGREYEHLESFNFNISKLTSKDNKCVLYTLYHETSPAMPKGRLVKMVGNVILFDGAIPYRKIPLYCVKPDSLLESPFGYTPAFELLGIQQGIDVLSTAIMTNNASQAVQNFWTKKGDDVSVRELTGGMKHIQSEEPPQAINLTKTAPETYNFWDRLEKAMETISGISSTVRGNPESSLKSGSALALVVSQSIQFASLFEQSYNELLEDLGTAIIDNLRDFSKTPRVAAILGESSRPYQKEFTGDDLSQINRVVVEQGSALAKTISGRVEIANQLMQQGMLETPKQYITVLTTGQLDPAIEGTQYGMLNIRSENEDMRDGQGVQAVVTENHADHIREHKTLIENPDAKKNPELVARVLGHIDEHLRLWRSADMAILMITGQQPPPPPPMQPGQPQMGPPPQGAPQGQPAGNPGVDMAKAELQQNMPVAAGNIPQDSMPSAPNMPTNPLSGEKFNNETGGL